MNFYIKNLKLYPQEYNREVGRLANISMDGCKNEYVRKLMDTSINKWTDSGLNEMKRLNTELCIPLVSQHTIQLLDKWRNG